MTFVGRIKYLIKNSLIFALGTLGTKIINFLLVPLYTNVLLPNEYGIADLVFTLGTFLVPILTLNINEAILRFSLDKESDSNKIMSVGLLAIVTMSCASLVAYPLISLYKDISEYSLLVLIYILSSGCSTIFMYNLRGKELLMRFSIGNIINAVTVASMNILFLKVLELRIEGYFLAYIVANIVTMVYSFCAGNVLTTVRNFSIDKKLMLSMLKYSIVLIPNSFMWWVMDSSNRVMLTAISGAAATGMYAIAGKIPSLVSVVSSIFNQAWNYSAIKESDSSDRLEYNNRVFDYLLFAVVVIASGILLVLKPFMSIYVEASYYESWKYTPPLILGAVILVLSTFMSSTYTVEKDSKGFLISATVGAVTNIVLNFALIPLCGAWGAAVSSCLGYTAVFIYRFFDTKRYLKLSVFTVKHIIQIICLVIAVVATYCGNVGYAIIIAELIVLLFVSKRNISEILNFAKGLLTK